jgi:hypothetical protein
LTEPTPRKVPVPTLIPTVAKTRTVPKSHYVTVPHIQKAIQEQKINNKDAWKKVINDAEKRQFSMVQRTALGPSERTRRTVEQIMKEKVERESGWGPGQQKIKFKSPPAALFRSEKAPKVKLTAAQILREEALVCRRLEQDKKQLEDECNFGMINGLTRKEWEQKQEDLKVKGKNTTDET